MAGFRSVIFDLDGLMIDSEPIFEETARRLLKRRGLTLLPQVLTAMMGTPARQALAIFRERHGLTEEVAELASESSDIFWQVLGEQAVPLMPGVCELLEYLEAQGIPKAIATSSSTRYVERALRPHGLLPRFAFALSCDDVTNGKPAPDVYQLAARRMGHDPAFMLVLEDSPAGLRAAKGAGASCAIVPHARVPLHDLAGADAVVSSLKAPELWRLIAGQASE